MTPSTSPLFYHIDQQTGIRLIAPDALLCDLMAAAYRRHHLLKTVHIPNTDLDALFDQVLDPLELVGNYVFPTTDSLAQRQRWQRHLAKLVYEETDGSLAACAFVLSSLRVDIARELSASDVAAAENVDKAEPVPDQVLIKLLQLELQRNELLDVIDDTAGIETADLLDRWFEPMELFLDWIGLEHASSSDREQIARVLLDGLYNENNPIAHCARYVESIKSDVASVLTVGLYESKSTEN